jgi:predicted amidohydrolase
MKEAAISRRNFNAGLVASIGMGLLPGLAFGADSHHGSRIKVAAVQMEPKLGDVESNLEQAERLILEAQNKGAEWIVLPEMFTTAMAFHPDMVRSVRSIDGAPARMLKRLATRGKTYIGGSFLARREGEVFNSFLLVSPDGAVQRHDKDQPTYWENCFYRGGSDDGVLVTPVGGVGSILCWEFIRSRTMRRLKERVSIVLGASCWWTLSDEVDADNPLRNDNLNMLKTAPVDCARMLGVPVVHASHAGRFNGYFSPELPDVPYDSNYLGETCVVDAAGEILSSMEASKGAGIVLAEVDLPENPIPLKPIPGDFWIPQQMPQPWKDSWIRWLDSGAHYYQEVMKPFLRTGEIREYIPEYLL